MKPIAKPIDTLPVNGIPKFDIAGLVLLVKPGICVVSFASVVIVFWNAT